MHKSDNFIAGYHNHESTRMNTKNSSLGAIAHAQWQDPGRIQEHATRDSELPRPDFETVIGRIDLHIEAPRVKFREMPAAPTRESSAQIRKRVIAVRMLQHPRFAKKPKKPGQISLDSRFHQ
jgi:hypothetical protein